jgi:hypothetical protein
LEVCHPGATYNIAIHLTHPHIQSSLFFLQNKVIGKVNPYLELHLGPLCPFIPFLEFFFLNQLLVRTNTSKDVIPIHY